MSEYYSRFLYRYSVYDGENARQAFQKEGCSVEMVEANDMYEDFYTEKETTIAAINSIRKPPSEVLEVRVHICNHDKGKPCEIVTLKEFKDTYGTG